MCNVSHVICHMSCVTCHFFSSFFFDKVVKPIVGGGVINRAYRVQFCKLGVHFFVQFLYHRLFFMFLCQRFFCVSKLGPFLPTNVYCPVTLTKPSVLLTTLFYCTLIVHCTIVSHTILYYCILHCNVIHFTVLHFIAVHCTVQFYSAVQSLKRLVPKAGLQDKLWKSQGGRLEKLSLGRNSFSRLP